METLNNTWKERRRMRLKSWRWLKQSETHPKMR